MLLKSAVTFISRPGLNANEIQIPLDRLKRHILPALNEILNLVDSN